MSCAIAPPLKKQRVDKSADPLEEQLSVDARPASGGPSADGMQRVKGQLQRYLITVEYVGTAYCGFQVQKDQPTVQGALESAFERFCGKVLLQGSSRTDTGVHALGNTAHVDIERVNRKKPSKLMPPYPPQEVQRAVNHFLQIAAAEVAVTGVRAVPPAFHARFNARERTYYYHIVCGPTPPSIFERNRVWHVPQALDVTAMQEACTVLMGKHDFSSFRATGCQAQSPVKTLDELSVVQVPSWPPTPPPSCAITPLASTPDLSPGVLASANGGIQHAQGREPRTAAFEEISQSKERATGVEKVQALRPATLPDNRHLVVTARGRSFLYHQVRLLVGMLKAVGCGLATAADVQKVLDAKNVTAAPAMAPAYGLFLAHVAYPQEDEPADAGETVNQ